MAFWELISKSGVRGGVRRSDEVLTKKIDILCRQAIGYGQRGRVVKATDSNCAKHSSSVGFARTGSNPVVVVERETISSFFWNSVAVGLGLLRRNGKYYSFGPVGVDRNGGNVTGKRLCIYRYVLI
jgi:hypothetical protein